MPRTRAGSHVCAGEQDPALQVHQAHCRRLCRAPPLPCNNRQLDRIVADLSELLGELLPPVSPGFWGLLMALSVLSLLPAAAGRAQPEFGKARPLCR